MKEFLSEPGFLGTYGTRGADLSYTLAILFTILFLAGWFMGRRHQGSRHHTLVLWAMPAMTAYFSFYYFIRGLGVLAIEGREGFGGSDWLYAYIFSPVLTIHILLASIGLVMAVYLIVLGFRASFKEDGRWLLRVGELRVKKKNLYLTLSITVTALGVLALIRCRTLRCVSVYGTGLLLVSTVILLEKIIEKFLPDGANRHRILGRFTMFLFLIVLFSSTLTYLFLYILYPPHLPD